MTFQGDTVIGKPTLLQIEIYIAEKGLCVEPDYVYSYWEAKDWKTNKGHQVKSLESAINVANGLYIEDILRKSNPNEIVDVRKKKKGKTKREKRIDFNSRIKQIKNKEKQLSDSVNESRPFIKYEDQLKDERWVAFRRFVKKVRGQKCEICGSTKCLQVHHTHYNKNCFAWEYTCNDVLVLCKDCHSKIHNKNQKV